MAARSCFSHKEELRGTKRRSTAVFSRQTGDAYFRSPAARVPLGSHQSNSNGVLWFWSRHGREGALAAGRRSPYLYPVLVKNRKFHRRYEYIRVARPGLLDVSCAVQGRKFPKSEQRNQAHSLLFVDAIEHRRRHSRPKKLFGAPRAMRGGGWMEKLVPPLLLFSFSSFSTPPLFSSPPHPVVENAVVPDPVHILQEKAHPRSA